MTISESLLGSRLVQFLSSFPMRLRMGVESASSSYLKFEISGVVCAISLGDVREILPMATLGRPPQVPRIIEGFLTLGSVIVPVFRLDRLLNLKERELDVDSHLISLKPDIKQPSFNLIVGVDRVFDVIVTDAAEISGVGESHTLNRCVKGEIRRPEGLIHVLDVSRLILEGEKRVLSELTLTEQKRLLELMRVAG